MGLVAALFVLTAFVSPSGASVEAVQDSTQTAWPSTIYYMALLGSPDGLGGGYGDVTIHITAVDDYTLYVNGEVVGTNSDGDWQTVESYPLTISSATINIGVEVHNDGIGPENGLMVDIEPADGSEWLGTSIKKRRSSMIGETRQLFPVVWYYYSGSLGELTSIAGDEWYVGGPSAMRVGDENVSIISNFKRVLLGSMGDIDFTPNPNIDIVTGYPGNVDIAVDGGGMKLRRIDGENIALGVSAEHEKLVDGDLFNGVPISQNPIDISYDVDLGQIYKINRMTLFTGSTSPDDWVEISVRGYAVEVSFDRLRWEEVGIIHDVGVSNADDGGHDYYSVEFPEEWARYVRFRILESRIDYPNIGEMTVYGTGYVYDGTYESDWLDFGDPTAVKNFDMVKWDGDVPDGTSIMIQTKSRYVTQEGAITESDWSLATSEKEFAFASPEPVTSIRYRVLLSTQDILKTPVLKSIGFTYSGVGQPISYADGFVFPDEIPMGEESTLEYTISYDLLAGQNLKQVMLSVPGFSSLNSVYSSELATLLTEDNNMVQSHSSTDTLYISFTDPIVNAGADAASDSLYISFNTKLLSNAHEVVAFLVNDTMNDGAGGVRVWENKDMGTWTVQTSSITKGVLHNVQASPEVFTPNGDGVNEFTVFEFELSKVTTNVKVNIYDTKGSLVSVVVDETLSPGTYLVPDAQKLGANPRDMVGFWDGTDEDGDMVPPGVYVYQVVAGTDDGDKVESGTVVVAY